MKTRLAAVAAALALATGAMTGCSGSADPAETTPLFSSEDEAFAAAEATYRAYVDALNAVDLSDPETFEDVYAWTTGDANGNERRTLSKMHADGWVVTGSTRVDSFQGNEFDESETTVVSATVCSNVSDVQVADQSGTSVVSPDRPPVYTLEVTFVELATTDTGLAISSSNAITDDTCDSP